MTKEAKEKKIAKAQLLIEAARLGRHQQLESILNQLQLKCKKKTNPLASLRKVAGPNNIRDPVTGFTCLHHASLNGHADCVKLILDHGAKRNAVDYKGSSALHLAAWAGNLEVVEILVDYRPNSTKSHHFGHGDGSQSGQARKSSVIEGGNRSSNQDSPTSSQSIIDIDLCNNDNQTPLSLAAQFGHNQVIATLLARGANVHLRNSQFESPLDLACLHGRLETVDLLLRSTPTLVAELKRPLATLGPGAAGASCCALAAKQQQQQHPQQLCGETGGSPTRSSRRSSPPSQLARRQSGGGWSSLFGGGSGGSGGGGSGSRRDSPNQSPLQRLTVGTLSMRQKNPTQQQQQDQSRQVSSENKRRATLMLGTSLPIQSQSDRHEQPEYQRRISADLVSEKKAAATTSNTSTGWHPADCNCNKLLGHSPIHYATRRGHIDILNLLLYTYQANILQVSLLGGILHEVALNNGKHSEIIKAIFHYFCNLKPNNSDSTRDMAQTMNKGVNLLDEFLQLKNAQQKSVFEVLDGINNRSAQEIKRLIYEFSEQVRTVELKSSSTATNVQSSVINLSRLDQQQLMGQTITNNNNTRQGNSSTNNTNTNEDFSNLAKKISDIYQIDSLVTMKRAPKNVGHTQTQRIFTDLTNHHYNSLAQLEQQRTNFPIGTQTIDRLRFSSGHQQVMMNRNQHQQQSAAYQITRFPAASVQDNLPTRQQQLDLQTYPNQQRLPAITRSFSSLTQQMAFGRHQQQFDSGEAATAAVTGDWQSWRRQGDEQHHYEQPMMQQQENVSTASLKRRSKSRDLGSLLMEVQRQQQHRPNQLQIDQDNLNDNSPSPFDNAPAPVLDGSFATAGTYLVRSQTDCSHLVGRLFGSGEQQQQQQQQVVAGSNMARHPQAVVEPQPQQPTTLDRKMINRHYHVYDHEFYPPRLLGNQSGTAQGANDAQVAGRQMVAVVPPLFRGPGIGGPFMGEQSSLRSSIRSTASCQVPASSSSNNKFLAGQMGAYNGPGGASSLIGGGVIVDLPTNNSRLSLNIEPSRLSSSKSASSSSSFQPKRNYETQLNRQASMVTDQQSMANQQMDRFLHRHSRKSAHYVGPMPPAPAPSSANLSQANSAAAKRDEERNQKEMPELQCRLVAESNQQQEQHLHNSYSLESHLSEPHLFESTRQALMKDFDQMIGNELLNRNHRQIIDGGLIIQQQQRVPPPVPPPPQQRKLNQETAQSILTGVSLDMDRLGERLIVSGTRVTMPDESSCKSADQLEGARQRGIFSASKRSLLSNNGSNIDLVSTPSVGSESEKQLLASPASNLSTSITSHGTQTTIGDDDDVDDYPREPPPKPPRLSLINKQQQPQRVTTSQRVPSGQMQRAVIYDLPSESASWCASMGPQSASAIRSKGPLSKDSPTGTGSALSNSFRIQAGAIALQQQQLQVAPNSSPNPNSLSSTETGGRAGRTQPTGFSLRAAQSLAGATDPDSGVCLSNSPGSHDSEEPPTSESLEAGTSKEREKRHDASSAVIKHLARSANAPANRGTSDLSMSPPSPKTAQLSIERVLLPLAKTIKTADKTTSSADLICPSQLRLESPQSFGSSLTSSASEEANDGDEDEDDDDDAEDDDDSDDDEDGNYASEFEFESSGSQRNGSDDSSLIASKLSQLSVSESTDGTRDNIKGDDKNDDTNDDDDGANQGEERMLKVVVSKACNEVVYINPSDLKKLAKKCQTDAETLTDEELCASFDKSSGFIRFTLRKRNQGDEERDNERNLKQADQRDDEVGKLADISGGSFKKTRLDSSGGEICRQATPARVMAPSAVTELVENQMISFQSQPPLPFGSYLRTRRHSELTTPSNQQPTVFSPKKNSLLSSSQSQLHQQRQDVNSNRNNEVSMRLMVNRQAASMLRQWFSMNLVALCDYVDKFLNFGFDNLQFINHPDLINDEALISLGILNEPHRVIIIDRITKEMPEVNFETLFGHLYRNSENCVKDIISLTRVFDLLQLSLPASISNQQLDLDVVLNSVESIEHVKQSISGLEALPVGYRNRLRLALDFICSKLREEEGRLKQQEQQQEATKKLSQQTSTESCEIDMDTSQTSSSSSKESIKSIVSMKLPGQPTQAEREVLEEANRIAEPSKAAVNQIEEEGREPVGQSVAELPAKEEQKVSVTSKVGIRANNSLVCEAARKLEAVAAQRNGAVPFVKPVAAARRVNINRLGQPNNQLASSGNKAFERSSNDTIESKLSPNPSKSALQKSPAFVPVRSICWPPKQQQQVSESESQQSQVASSKVSDNLSTYKKNVEPEQAQRNKLIDQIIVKLDGQAAVAQREQHGVGIGGASVNKLGPKPAPPTKPAKLVAGAKFNAASLNGQKLSGGSGYN